MIDAAPLDYCRDPDHHWRYLCADAQIQMMIDPFSNFATDGWMIAIEENGRCDVELWLSSVIWYFSMSGSFVRNCSKLYWLICVCCRIQGDNSVRRQPLTVVERKSIKSSSANRFKAFNIWFDAVAGGLWSIGSHIQFMQNVAGPTAMHIGWNGVW